MFSFILVSFNEETCIFIHLNVSEYKKSQTEFYENS